MTSLENLRPAPGPGSGPAPGPKVTMDAIEAAISSVHFTNGSKLYQPHAADPLSDQADKFKPLTVCVLLMKNGFTVVGTSACADPQNYNQEIGEKLAYSDCIRQIWPLMGFELRSRLAQGEQA